MNEYLSIQNLRSQIVSASKEAKAIKQEELSEGTLVEVRSDEEGFRGSWYAAKVVKVEGQDKYLVQFKGLRTDGDKEFLKEKVDKQNIRPYPPEAIIVDGFDLNEKVDAFFNDGWWEGVICKILKGGRYKVYFKESDEELVFEHCDLRPHQDWINETWVMASQVFVTSKYLLFLFLPLFSSAHFLGSVICTRNFIYWS